MEQRNQESNPAMEVSSPPYKGPEKKVLTSNQKKALKNKKNKLLKKIKDQIETDDVDEEGAQKIAEQWVNIADVDGNGLIDFKEYKDFVMKLEEGSEEQPTEEEL